jgi:hypothetical protein
LYQCGTYLLNNFLEKFADVSDYKTLTQQELVEIERFMALIDLLNDLRVSHRAVMDYPWTCFQCNLGLAIFCDLNGFSSRLIIIENENVNFKHAVAEVTLLGHLLYIDGTADQFEPIISSQLYFRDMGLVILPVEHIKAETLSYEPLFIIYASAIVEADEIGSSISTVETSPESEYSSSQPKYFSWHNVEEIFPSDGSLGVSLPNSGLCSSVLTGRMENRSLNSTRTGMAHTVASASVLTEKEAN